MAVTSEDAASTTRPRAQTEAAGVPGAGRRLTPEAIGIGVVVAIGVVARFVTSSPLWLDEALSVNIASLPLGEIPEALRHDGHPPLYYFLLHGWIRLVGDGDVAVRVLSGLLSVGALGLLGLAARRAAGIRAAWASVVLAAILPFAVRYGTEARMYSLVMALVAGGYLLVRAALASPRPGRLVAVAAVSGGLLLTHYWALWLVVAVVGVLGWRALRHREGAERRPTLWVGGAIAAGGVLFVPWLSSLAYQIGHTGTPWGDAVRPTVIVQVGLVDFGSAVTGTGVAEGGLIGIALALLFVIALFGRRLDDHRIVADGRPAPDVRREAVVVGVVIAVAAVASYVTDTTFASRYLAVVFPLFILVCGAGLAKLPGRPSRFVVAGVVVCLSLVGVGVNVFLPRTQAREVAQAVADDSRPGDVVVFCPDQLGPAVSRELPEGLDEVVYPSLAGPALVDWVDYAERYESAAPDRVADEVVARAGADATVWLVTSTGYKVSHHCDRFAAALDGRRGAPAAVVAEAQDVFEPAALLRFDPN
ncbi:MAG: glycosyltransferase family 39 protein [Acidimicrobiales bacterium]